MAAFTRRTAFLAAALVATLAGCVGASNPGYFPHYLPGGPIRETHAKPRFAVFRDFDPDRIVDVGNACAELLTREDGLDVALRQIHTALPAPLRETAYALACEVAAADGRPAEAELQMLEMLRHRLGIDRLIAAGIERGIRARHRTL